MSSSQTFPTLAGTIDQAQMGVDSNSGAEWYNPPSYPYNDPYMATYPTSTMEDQTWPPFVRTSVSDNHINSYGMHHFGDQHTHQQMNNAHRPRSSPSHLGLSGDGLTWPRNGLGIQYTPPSSNVPTPPVSSTFPPISFSASAGIPTPPVSSTFPPMSYSASAGVPTPPISSTFPPMAFSAAAGISTPPVTSTFPPVSFQAHSTDDFYNIPSPEMRQVRSRKSYASIAPNPSPVPEKRKFEDDEEEVVNDVATSSKRRKRCSSAAASATLNDEDKLLLKLKEDENLPWKEVIVRFKAETNKSHTVASLQMRYKRLRDKHRVWEDADVEALRKAHEYWENSKWDIISAKMIDFGIDEKWPSRHCGRKWQELENLSSIFPGLQSHFTTPTSVSQLSSPIEGPMQFSWVSMSG